MLKLNPLNMKTKDVCFIFPILIYLYEETKICIASKAQSKLNQKHIT